MEEKETAINIVGDIHGQFIIRDAVTFCEHAKRKTVTAMAGVHRYEKSKEYADTLLRRLVGGRGRADWLQAGDMLRLCHGVTPILACQPMLVEPKAPAHIVGDLHGQFADLCRIFDAKGLPSDKNAYLFLGDYVDRGSLGSETVATVFALKILYPKSVYILRGNHKCASVNRRYGFFSEVKGRFGEEVWDKSPRPSTGCPSRLSSRSKFSACTAASLLTSTHWTRSGRSAVRKRCLRTASCATSYGPTPNHSIFARRWQDSSRGPGVQKSSRSVVKETCERLSLSLIVRGHQVVQDGYEFFADRHLVTVFSAPNYCGEFDNAGGILTVDQELMVSTTILPPNKKRHIAAFEPFQPKKVEQK